MSIMEYFNDFRAAGETYEAALDAIEAGVASVVGDAAADEAARREKRAIKALIASRADEPAELAAKFRVLADLIEQEVQHRLSVKLHRSASADFTAFYQDFMT